MYQRMMLDIIKSYVEAVTYVKNSDVPRDDARRKKSYVEAVYNVCDDKTLRSLEREISSNVNMSE